MYIFFEIFPRLNYTWGYSTRILALLQVAAPAWYHHWLWHNGHNPSPVFRSVVGDSVGHGCRGLLIWDISAWADESGKGCSAFYGVLIAE